MKSAHFSLKNGCLLMFLQVSRSKILVQASLRRILDFETLVCKVFREKMEKLFGYTADHAMFSGNECDLADDPLV